METNQLAHRARSQPSPPARLARGLGWFSIAFGVVELLMPRTVARACGMKDGAGVVRLYGLREIACGVGILRARNPEPWLWGRVAGDVMDASTVIAEADLRDERALQRNGIALAKIVAITALDVHAARNAQPPRKQPGIDFPDYGDRVGMPKPPDQMRGVARKDVHIPRDMRTPEALRPWTEGATGPAPSVAATAESAVAPPKSDEPTEHLARGDFT